MYPSHDHAMIPMYGCLIVQGTVPKTINVMMASRMLLAGKLKVPGEIIPLWSGAIDREFL
jgi:hypothetical protein